MQQGDIGAAITAVVTQSDGTPRNVTGATSIVFWLRAPSGAVKQLAGTVTDGPQGRFQCLTASATDLNEPGVWSVQVAYQLAGFNGRTSVGSFAVERNL